MGRRRVLVLAPAITRMQCMSNPYKRVKNGSRDREEESGTEPEVIKRKGSTSFWSSWRERKSSLRKKTKRKNVGKGGQGRSRSWGFRVTSKLTIRILSPAYWMKKLRDSYINLMLALERNAPLECSGMVTYPAHTAHQRFPGGAPAGDAWVWPGFTPPVVF